MDNASTGGFDRILAELRERSANTAEQGKAFECLMRKFFETCPPYSNVYEKVWRWCDFPYNGNTQDRGIDLVAKRRGCHEYDAIQCKFYAPDTEVSKSDVDTFLAESGRSFIVDGTDVRYTARIIISTTDKWSAAAEATISRQEPPVTRIRLQDIRSWGIDWDSVALDKIDSMQRQTPRSPLPHQRDAINAVRAGFEDHERGKLIMACGTGKTYTSWKITEERVGERGNVLFLVPSISLLNQALVEWSAECKADVRIFAVCSDAKASRTSEDETLLDAILPATTDVKRLTRYYKSSGADSGDKLCLFFSTYQSISVVSEFQKQTGLIFDLIVCDEAHRTTGVTIPGRDEKGFSKVHDNTFLPGKKRLYMTATPRVYGDAVKSKADERNYLLCSMDDEEIYGPEFFRLGFSEAVDHGLLSDYKVIILGVDEEDVSKSLQGLLSADDGTLELDDAVKIVGCLNGLSKKVVFGKNNDCFGSDTHPMKRAVAFTGNIKASKKFAQDLMQIQQELARQGEEAGSISVECRHVDGTQNALVRKQSLDWLKEDSAEGECRVLSNARCLSEGIDVPALDAVIFLNSRDSMIDVIQSVGRVMRKAPGKKYGYIILPIGYLSGVDPSEALNDNKTYKVVWSILQALRAHDDRFNATINQIQLNNKKPGQIGVGKGGTSKKKEGISGSPDEDDDVGDSDGLGLLDDSESEYVRRWTNAIFARIVQKCGAKAYWENWAGDISKIAERRMAEVAEAVQRPELSGMFRDFVTNLQKNLNASTTPQDAIEMLAEQMIMEPVFEALFEDYNFASRNPVSQMMRGMLDALNQALNASEAEQASEQKTFVSFGETVHERVKGLDNAQAKQRIILELYENFFKNALPKQREKLGIVYTPTEIVNFILNSVEDILVEQFGRHLYDSGVHILDPFTGTGTFLVQLLRSGLIPKERMAEKYQTELHANEIMLLAYYTAAINIEETYHDVMRIEEYVPFPGIVLGDTFAMSERLKDDDDHILAAMAMDDDNLERAVKQLNTPITVIIGNPPYSVGQKSANDNNQNVKYSHLDKRISDTYASKSNASLLRNVYDSYVRAFRWASDRIGSDGIIAFVTNGAFVKNNAFDGFRKCLLEEFTSIYCLDLRGDARTSGEQRKRECGNVFLSGSRAPIAITILVKNSSPEELREDAKGLHYHDIGDYVSREGKLNKLIMFRSINGVTWDHVTPNEHQDWVRPRSPEYKRFTQLWDKDNLPGMSFFGARRSLGLVTARDVWTYSFSSDFALEHASDMVRFYNMERIRCFSMKADADEEYLQSIRCNDPRKISWSSKLMRYFCENSELSVNKGTRVVMYRPFCKKWLAYTISIIERPGQWNKIFPMKQTQNLIIAITSTSLRKPFSALMSDCIQDVNMFEFTNCFPLYFYGSDKDDSKSRRRKKSHDADQSSFWDTGGSSTAERRPAISEKIVESFQTTYNDPSITHEDIFYYIYAVLQSRDYIHRYADNLSKEMPRIPYLKDFWAYSHAGRLLGDLHVHYERTPENAVDPASLGIHVTKTAEDYHVDKMRFAKSSKPGDKSTIIFNEHITLTGIPPRAYEYIVNGKSAVEWVMERYAVTTDKASRIVDDPNWYGDEQYIYRLLLSVIALSVRTEEILDNLPTYEEL